MMKCTMLFTLTPVCMRHVLLLAGACFLLGIATYAQFLHLRGGYELSSSDPGLWGLLVVGFSSAAACLVGVAVRYRLARDNMISFLNSIKR
jgi:hypothetical protein